MMLWIVVMLAVGFVMFPRETAALLMIVVSIGAARRWRSDVRDSRLVDVQARRPVRRVWQIDPQGWWDRKDKHA